MTTRTRTWFGIVLLGVLLAGVAYQLFYRFDYVHLAGGRVMKIDRLYGNSCYLPCTPASPTPLPTKSPSSAWDYLIDSPDNVDTEREQAIELVKTRSDASTIETNNSGYEWTARWARGVIQAASKPTNTKSKTFMEEDLKYFDYMQNLENTSRHTYLVCYCNSKSAGWDWEVHLDSHEVFFANDNTDLSEKYGLTKSQ